ncbi:hypothetical protein KBC75_03130 [Candidatus Shapirobacteria bacterium]|nr:hypothetical protein [Candidatus Shapirobacteria bacterium]
MKSKNTSDFIKNKDKSFILNITVSIDTIKHEYEHVLDHAVADFSSKGFRKGKVPRSVVASQLSTQAVIEEVMSHSVSHIYADKIKEHDLHPIVQPQIKILNPPVTLDKEWFVEITGSELPEIILDDKYLVEVKKINASKDNENQKLNSILESLLKHSQVELPDILIKADVDNKLAQLVDQTKDAGITVKQYLQSKNTTLEDYQKDLEVKVRNEWITNLAINEIALKNKLSITAEEVKALTDKNPELAKNTNLVYYLLTQQKVFDFLKKI